MKSSKEKKGKRGNIEELYWQRILCSTFIPRYLVEQIAKRSYSVDDLYTYMEENLLIGSYDSWIINPLFHVYGLMNPENLMKGFLWFNIDPLSKDIFIQVYSVDNHYWGSKDAILKLIDYIKEIRKTGNLKKVYWITKFPKHSIKYGFEKSNSTLMEYNEQEKEDGRNNDGITGDNESSDTPTTTVL